MPNERRRPVSKTTARARELRHEMTDPERLVWSLVRNRRLAGLKFRRQYPVGPYIADFYCESAKLVLELDGESHDGRGEYDKRRQRFLESQRLRVLRVSNDDVFSDLESVAWAIARAAGVDLETWLGPSAQQPPSPPTPLPKGEGSSDQTPRPQQ